MEANLEALDSFMCARPAQNSGNGSSYLAWIKSRYPQENSKVQEINNDDWRQDYETSNVSESTVQATAANINATSGVDDDGALESVDLTSTAADSSIHTLLHAMSFNSPVKVDNFYIDGEETVPEPDLAFYMPSGMKDTAVIETDPTDHEHCDCEQSPHTSHIPQESTVKKTQQAGLVNDLTVTYMDFDEDGNSEESEKCDLDFDAETAGDHAHHSVGTDNAVETLYFSEDEEDEHCTDRDNNNDASLISSDNINTELSHAEMVAALAEFQQFSPRYRDINSAVLLQAMQPGAETAEGVSSTNMETVGECGESEVTRWYDDVEEFSPVM